MRILLFILYSVVGGYAILRLPFFRNSGLRPGVLLTLFAIHVLTGCLHNLIAWRYYPFHGDIWTYYENSIATRDELFNRFHDFLRDNSTWNFFTHNSLINIHLILNFFSREDLYINTLLFSFPVFLGTTALFRVFRRHFPGSMLPALGVYVLPSALFWTSCVHREGALYMLLGFFFYSIDRLSLPGPANRSRPWVSAALSFLFIAYFRSAVALTLIPGLAAWWWLSLPSSALRKKTLLTSGLGLLIILVLTGPTLLKGLAAEQQSFQILTGNSRISLPVLDGTWSNFLHTLPAALLDGWLEPLPGAGGQKIYTAFSLELLLIWAIVALALIRRATASPSITGQPPSDHFRVCCILFALSGMLIVGLVVPFVGAIVRYRSIYLPFLLAPPLHWLCTFTALRRLDQWTAHRL